MDGNKYAIVWELLKAICGIGLIYWLGDWFGASAFLPWIKYVLVGYFVISVIMTFIFTYSKNKENISLEVVNS